MKLSVLLLLFGGLTAHAEMNVCSGFAHALALMARDQREEAYGILEPLFQTKACTALEREQAAMILAFARNKQLKIHTRAEYAEYALSGQAAGPKERRALLRIAGDGRFDHGDLDRASRHFQQLNTEGEAADRDYATYKLGWIELNQDHAALAFQSWLARLNENRAFENQLRDSYVRDLGRAWAETKPVDPTQADASQSFSFSSGAEEALFVDGVVSGVRRREKPGEMEAFRAILFRTRFAQAVTAHMLDRKIGFNKEACSFLDWASAPVRISDLPGARVLETLDQCVKMTKKGSVGPRLVETAMKVQVSGMDRWPRAEIYRAASDNAASCTEFVTMANEVLPSQGEASFPPAALQNLLYTCTEALKTGTGWVSAAFADSFSGVLKFAARAKKISLDPAHPLYALTSQMNGVPAFRESLQRRVFEDPNAFHGTLLPSILAENLTRSGSATNESSEKLLNEFAPVPLIVRNPADQIWIEILRTEIARKLKAGDFTGAQQLLSHLLPLNLALQGHHPYTAELWALWALSVPERDPRFQQLGQELARRLIRSLGAGTSKEAQDSALAVALRYGEMEDLWAGWKSKGIERLVKPEIFAPLMERTYDALVATHGFVSAEARAGLQRHQTGRVAWEGYRFSQIKTPSKSDWADLTEALEPIVEKLGASKLPGFVGDLKMLSTFHEEGLKVGHKSLALNSRLPKEIETMFRTLDSEVMRLKSFPWSDPKWLASARKEIAGHCAVVVDRLQHIRLPKGVDAETKSLLDSQVKEVVSLIHGWKSALEATPAPGAQS